METIPKKSQANLKSGNWLIFNDDENTIQIWTSNLTGMEKVYLNSELISEKRNLKLKESHVFADKNGDVEKLFVNPLFFLKMTSQERGGRA